LREEESQPAELSHNCVFCLVIALLPVRVRHEALNAVSQVDNIEVYRQSGGFAT